MGGGQADIRYDTVMRPLLRGILKSEYHRDFFDPFLGAGSGVWFQPSSDETSVHDCIARNDQPEILHCEVGWPVPFLAAPHPSLIPNTRLLLGGWMEGI